MARLWDASSALEIVLALSVAEFAYEAVFELIESELQDAG
jgi:hypothetical protein